MASGNPTVRRRRLGLILRLMRTDAGLTGEEVGKRLERSDSWVSRVETARQALRPRDLRDLLSLYGVTNPDIHRELEMLARDSKERRWWSHFGSSITGPYASYIGFEDEGTSLLCFDAAVINGLLQTEEYAKALNSQAIPRLTAEESDRLVEIRLTRQRRLVGDKPLKLWAVMDEAVLRRCFAGPEVQRTQLLHLVDVTLRSPHVSIQILPLVHALHPGMTASFTIIEFPPPDQPIVFNEAVNGMSVEDDTDAHRYRLVFDELRAASLSKAESLKLIRDMVHQIV
ncbi:transcriptional regulator with XRE-family HTH domain [Allocatelliglobosispora scoriae]|uniref:Transcriptional regulator with XRE-family HTH domain n=1 Tax=Allocatelliglobosispora scoriae TaxID=643052 RepID=A0A841BK49_9ACTN|nr:helix-turn-helix transcriptional regulator [Allocatelliglobosispora scoriae]MBB5868644.1 transcriptional regulator with XRE-family HTH domain [Allocatelliglobosispora scoriae]